MTTLEAVNRFNEAFNRQDLDAVMDTFSDDCVFDNSTPRPDGERFVGQVAVRAFWEKWFAGNPDAKFESEEMIVSGDRCTCGGCIGRPRRSALASARRGRLPRA
jgi:ketosteroid isomerase-like protein